MWRWCKAVIFEAWYSSALDLEELLSGAVDTDIDSFVADVVKSSDTVHRDPCWFRHAYFQYHAVVRLQFKLS